jgi:uncharacterized protein (TIGR02466 family)
LGIDTYKDTKLSVNSSHKTFSKLYTLPQFAEFSKEVLEACKDYGRILGYDELQVSKFRFNSMWFNQSDKGDFNFPHIHNGCLMSGVFYIKTNPENTIVFQDLTDTIAEPNDPNPLSWRSRWVKCVPGNILIFKSDVIHSNPRQENDGEKLIISFNVTMDLD